MASKLVKARAAKAAQTIGTRVVTETLGKAKGRKVQKAMAAIAPLQEAPKAAQIRPYMVMVDSQGVGYLRTANTEKGSQFVLNTGNRIEMVEMDAATIKSRALKAVPEASISDTVKILAQPLTSSVIISDRARKALDAILNDKEFIEMAKATKSAKAAKKATKTTASAKSGSTRSAEAVVAFKKAPKDGELPAQAAGIVALVKAAGKLTIEALLKKMEGKITTKQTMQTIFSFYKARLVKEGYVTVTAPASA